MSHLFQAWCAAEECKQLTMQEEAAIAREHQAFQQMLPDLLAAYCDHVRGHLPGESDRDRR